MTDYFGPFFNELYQIKYAFSTGVFSTLAPSMLNLLRTGATLYITLIFFSMIFQPEKGKERAEGLKVSIACFVLAIILLSQTGKTSNVLEVFWAIEDMSLAISIEILKKLPEFTGTGALPYPLEIEQATIMVGGESVVNGYSVLASLIEHQMLSVLKLFADIAYGDGSFLGPAIVVRVIMAIIGMLPFLFVLGIFAAFMAEAMFKYVAMSTAAPILITLFPVKFFRPFSTAGIRILIGAFFTLIFAAGAMGFTLIAVDNFKGNINNQLLAGVAASKSYDSIRFRFHCGKYMGWWDAVKTPAEILELMGGDLSVTDLDPPISEEVCKDTIERAEQGSWIVFDPAFLMLIVIGFLSVLLHLSAKTLASNISGANDGPGPAAAVVMGAKMAAGGGAAMAMKYGGGAMFGRGGAGASVSDIMNGNKNVTAGGVQGLGQSLAAHGVVGTAIGAFNPFRGGKTPPPESSSGLGNIGSNRFSTGGGNGSMMSSPQEKKEFADMMTQSFAKAMRENGMGRNRDGS